jgi:GT2 family glycosyltransferase
VVIVVLHWGEPAVTVRCLASLSKATYADKSVFVVDNGEEPKLDLPATPAALSVSVVRPAANVGFCAGANLGFAEARRRGARHVLLLNNDTVVEPDFLDALVAFGATVPSPAVLCPQIVFLDAPERAWYAGGEFSLWSGIPRQRYKGRPLPVDMRPQTVDYATGCALLLDLAVADAVGDLDAAFFAYCEDLDFSLRARAAGFPIFVVPAARIYHDPSTDERAIARRLYYSTRNLLEVMRRHAAWYQWISFLPSFALRWVTYHGALACLRGRVTRLAWMVRATRDFAAGRLGQVRA